MSTITTRAGKGSPLTNAEVDANFTNLNSDKYQSGDDAVLASVQLTGGSGDQGKVSWNTDEETLDVILNGSTLQVGQEVHYHVRNNSGSTISDGDAVYATGTIGASGRITVSKYIADGTIDPKFFLGIATEEITNDTDGKIAFFGKVRGIDLSAFTDGDVLYPSASTAGALTATAPTGSDVALPIGFVIHAASNGTLFVRATNLDSNYFAPYSDTQRKNTEVVNSSATTTIDFSKQNYIITLVGNTTLALSNVAGNVGATGTIVLKQDATGGRTITFPTQFKTPRGETIVQETAANGISAVNYFVVDGSTVLINYIGDFG